MKRAIIFCVLFLALPLAAYCQQVSSIELTDGSVINGEIVSYVNGVYTINTSAFGQIKLKEAQVYKIQTANPLLFTPPASSPLQGNNPFGSGGTTYGQKLMNNPENTAIITGLATDPQIQDLAQDPQIVDAAKTGDIQALMKNRKFMDIVNNPELQRAMDKLKQ